MFSNSTLARAAVASAILAFVPGFGAADVADAGASPKPFRLAAVAEDLVSIEWERHALQSLAAAGRAFSVRGFPLRSDLSVDLRLEPFSVVSADTEFVLGRQGLPDEPLDFDAASLTLLRGTVAGRPGSHVFLALSDGSSTGYVDLGAGYPRYRISADPADPERLAVFRTESPLTLPPGVRLCEVHDAQTASSAPAPAGASTPLAGRVAGLKHVELAVETDHEFFVLFGDADAATAYLVQLYAEISDIYIRDVDTRLELVFTRVWPEANDPFNSTNPLPEFRNYWNDNMGAVDRDVAQLLSGRRNYPFGGQGYLGGLCGSSAYSVVGYALGFFPDPSMPSPYHYDIGVSAHELGHNFGTGHTQDNGIDQCHNPTTTPQRGSIMSYCSQTWSGMNAIMDLYFHSTIQANMDGFLSGAGCVAVDCNRNNVDDDDDVQLGTSDDANANNVPDECEDCNGNSILDPQDIASATSLDLNLNGVPDECEPDCNDNDVPDGKDITDGTSSDLYGNDVPDECETDCDLSGTSDYTEIQLDMPLDLDRNAVLDACQDCDDDQITDMQTLNGAHNLWVASGLANSQLRQLHSTAGVLTEVSDGSLGALVVEGQDLVVTQDGRVLVSSIGDHRVMEFSVEGDFVGDLVSPGSAGLSAPTGLLLTPDGSKLLVASSATDAVLAYDVADGTPLGAFVPAGSAGLNMPFGMTWGPDGDLYVTHDVDEVYQYDGQDGSFVRVFVTAVANGGLAQPRGLTFKADGNLLVTSFDTDEVLEYDGATGAPLGKWAQVGTASVLTQTSPWGIRVGPNGNVFVGRTGEEFGNGHEHEHDLGHLQIHGIQLHLSNAQIYEYDVRNGNFLRTHTGGNDHGVVFPTGFDFVPGWETDCNFNLIQDDCDVASGSSADGNVNGVPDECEVDCNANGRLDRLDIIPFGVAFDCNSNLTPDECDLGSGTSIDCDATGVPDECESVTCASCGVDGDCNDGLACTAQTCNTTLGQCVAVVNAGQCLIEAACYGATEPNPLDGCEICDPASSEFDWSPAFVPEVLGVTLANDGGTSLSWPDQGAGHVYDVAGDLLSVLRSTGGVETAECLADDEPTAGWVDPRPDPVPGEAYYYLVRTQSVCGDGSYGSATSGVERQPTTACP